MVIRLVVGVVLSAVVLMVWGFVFWMVLPYSQDMMEKLPDEGRVANVLVKEQLESGTYFLPYPDRAATYGQDPEAKAAFERKHQSGPLVQITYQKEGVGAMSADVFAKGFAQFLVASLLAALLLLLAMPNLPGYLGRVLFVFLIGLFAVVAITLANPVWYHHPWKFALYQAGFQATGWLLAGAVLGLVIRPRRN